MRRAASRGSMSRVRVPSPSTTMRNWRLEPPPGVRRQPASSSKRALRLNANAARAVWAGPAKQRSNPRPRRQRGQAQRRGARRGTARRASARSAGRYASGSRLVRRRGSRQAAVSRAAAQGRATTPNRRRVAAGERRRRAAEPSRRGAKPRAGTDQRRQAANGLRRIAMNEYAWTRLRQKMRRVDRQRPESIVRGLGAPRDRGEIRPALGGEHAGDVLEHDQPRGARRCAVKKLITEQKPQKAPERAPSRPSPRAPASDRSWHGNEAQARSARPGEIGGAKRGDVGYPKLPTSPIGGVSRALARIDVVGEQAPPLWLKSGARHAAAAKELVESGHRWSPPIEGNTPSLADFSPERASRRLTRAPVSCVYGRP